MVLSMAVLDAVGKVELLQHLFVALKELDGIPAGEVVGHDAALVPAAVGVMVMHGFLPVAVRDQILDMRQGVLHAPGEHVRRFARLLARQHARPSGPPRGCPRP